MKKSWKNLLTLAFAASVSSFFVACDDDDNNSTPANVAQNIALATVNANYVNNVVVPTYSGLADASEKLVETLEAFDKSQSQADLEAAGKAWIDARKYWEWSEAFLFGAASGYSIDPHIDTWPFDKTAFENYMKKYNPSDNDDDAAILEEAIATGQNLTGFHAVEYLIFREGMVRQAADLTANEIWFAVTAARDLYLNSCKLLVAWKGEVNNARTQLLEEAEFEADNFGEEFANAGLAGSRWKSATLAAIQIIEGAQDIIGEVSEGKIGAAHTGEDVNYIESPHSYNSITDFYDNIISVKHALYGTMAVDGVADAAKAASGSLMAYAYLTHAKEALAVSAALEKALDEIDGATNGMKRPFVTYYSDNSAQEAMDALDELDETLDALKNAIED
ncbi:MAG: hypothetical protein MJZ15_04680 [Bacteroidales bacterium]|nr:hypothetical protein [Bacteroidales bacterium]